MIVFNSLEEVRNIRDTVVVLGNFDGVHMGHRKLISRAVEVAKRKNLKSAVFTFSNHPRNLIAGRIIAQSILSQDDKIRIMKKLGVDYVFNVPFTWDICNMSPEEFVKELLVGTFKMKHAVCGFNYHYGSKAAGNPQLLEEMGGQLGYEVDMFEPVMINGNIVSSTFIRGLIETGQVDLCRRYMGERYQVKGEVVKGNQIGRTIGFPTVNQFLDEGMVSPSNGVYVTTCTFDNKTYPSITNVGVKPTIGVYKKNVETHIFDYSGDLYGKTVVVEFLKKTRDEQKFDSFEELKEQISKDCIVARRFHDMYGIDI